MEHEFTDTTPVQENPAEIKAPENVFLGIIGALVGAAIGGASIVLLNRLGYVASLSGLLLAFCTMKGYELLAKSISKKGIVICVVLMLVTPFVADWIDWALIIMESWADMEIGFIDAVFAVPLLMEEGAIEMTDYFSNLGMIYLFAVLGGFYTVKNALKK